MAIIFENLVYQRHSLSSFIKPRIFKAWQHQIRSNRQMRNIIRDEICDTLNINLR